MFVMLYRRSSLKLLLTFAVLCGFLMTAYYINCTYNYYNAFPKRIHLFNLIPTASYNGSDQDSCSPIYQSGADIDTTDTFQNLDFKPSWLGTNNFWTSWFESRLRDLNRNHKRVPLKVILVPFSHNDPGWLETFEYYLHEKTTNILNNVVANLRKDDNTTFIWSEIAFLANWWKLARTDRRFALSNLVQEGRIEIVGGGWVMPDEATTHLYGLIDQFLEGHQWVFRNLGVKPKTGWSIDPFGHGSTVPHILALSGFNATVIQRIHYAWKHWFAYQRSGDFHWKPNFASEYSILTHHQPFDLYGVKENCGPNPDICAIYNYKSHTPNHVYRRKFADNLDDLIGQYIKSGSLYKHNVILVPIGGDFSYTTMDELTGQYYIYNTVIEEVKERYPEIDIYYGTPKHYFEEMVNRQASFPHLKGDFFAYADSFSSAPSYWTGFYTSRPFLKILDRILAAQLRSCEILYTLTLNYARYFSNLKWDFKKIVEARRVLALFQHHDSITGTSKSFVVKDHIVKLTHTIVDVLTVQRNAISVLYTGNNSANQLITDDNFDFSDDFGKKHVFKVSKGVRSHVVIFNSLQQERYEAVKLSISDLYVKIKNEHGEDIPIQISPVWRFDNKYKLLSAIPDKYELCFIAKLPPLSVVVYEMHYFYSKAVSMAALYTNDYFYQNDSEVLFPVKKILPNGLVKMENAELLVVLNAGDGLLRRIHKRSTNSKIFVLQEYSAYQSYQYRSGAYLFEPDTEGGPERPLLEIHQVQLLGIIGDVYSELITAYDNYIIQKLRIYQSDSYLSEAIFIETTVDLSLKPTDTELVMRLNSNIDSRSIFFTDSNGFQIQKRQIVKEIGVQGNYYPVTTMIYIEDYNQRLSLLTSHSHGATSFGSGEIEVMLDRSTNHDDGRGLEENMIDNKICTHKFILLPEKITNPTQQIRHFLNHFYDETQPVPSHLSNHLSNSLNYPLNVYVNVKASTSPSQRYFNFFNKNYGCNLHWVNLRTIPDDANDNLPSKNAFLILQNQGFSCKIVSNFSCRTKTENSTRLNYAIVKYMKRTLLTGFPTNEEKLRNIGKISINPMEIMTYNVTFR